MKREELEYRSTPPYLVVHGDAEGNVVDSFNVSQLDEAVRLFWCYIERRPWTRAVYDSDGRHVAHEVNDDPPRYMFDMTREAMKATQKLDTARPLGLVLEGFLDAAVGDL